MDLGRQIINFIRLCFLDNTDEVGRIGHVSVMQIKGQPFKMRIVIQVIDPVGVE